MSKRSGMTGRRRPLVPHAGRRAAILDRIATDRGLNPKALEPRAFLEWWSDENYGKGAAQLLATTMEVPVGDIYALRYQLSCARTKTKVCNSKWSGRGLAAQARKASPEREEVARLLPRARRGDLRAIGRLQQEHRIKVYTRAEIDAYVAVHGAAPPKRTGAAE